MREVSATCLSAAFEAFAPTFELVSSGEDTEDDGLRQIDVRAPPLPIVRWCGVCCTGWGVLLMVATVLFLRDRQPSSQAALATHSASTSQAPRPTAHTSASGCRMCTWCEEWVHEPTSKFHGMWGIARRTLKLPQEPTCWDRRGGQRFFEAILAGGGCDRKRVEPSLVEPTVAPLITPAAALLGFEADILKYCGSIVDEKLSDRTIAAEADAAFLLASTCARANKNVLQFAREDSSSWDMCQHMEWQMCAATGKLPSQGSSNLEFAFAPGALDEQWFENPMMHPTFPCTETWCPNNTYTMGDMFIAEVCIFQQICRNSYQMFDLSVGQTFVCEVDTSLYNALIRKLLLAAREANRRNPPKPVGNPWFVTPPAQESGE